MRNALLGSLLCCASATMAFAAVLPSDGVARYVLDEAAAARFAHLALSCVTQEYPNKVAHSLRSDADVAPPRLLTPAFFGCYDWHSSVHGHWLLARLARLYPQTEIAVGARAALNRSLSAANINSEVNYLDAQGRTAFERPYGMAWLLTLAAELRSWNDSDASRWAATLAPLERAAASHIAAWLPKLHYPIRIGEHNQTAFSFGLIWDWAQRAHDERMLQLLRDRSKLFYGADRACPLAYEPSGEDFLSPCLAEADLMRRILPHQQFAHWLDAFLPQIPRNGATTWLPVGVVTDRADPKLAHIDGLNLSRAWMLRAIAAALPRQDPRRRALQATADEHIAQSLPAVTGAHYEGGHWLGTFAVYLLSNGIS